MRRSILLLALTALAVVLTACGAADDEGPAIDPVPDDANDDVGSDPSDDEGPEDDEVDAPDDGAAAGSDPLLGPEIDQVIADVTERAGVDADEVEITVTELVTWPDGAIGCPEPDSMYTQALVEGYRIVVEADGRSWTYHGENGSAPFHCDDPQEPAEIR